MEQQPKVKKYLIDANLPYYFSMWNSEKYIHQFDLDPKAKDEDIWNYAKSNELTIITKDSDFTNRLMLFGAPPKVIHIKLGNMKLKDLYNYLNENWSLILEQSENNRLVRVYLDKLEAIK